MNISDMATIADLHTAWDRTLVTRGGVTMTVRSVLPNDGPILRDLFANVSPNDLRFRFFSGLRQIDDARIAQMIDVDYRTTITFLAFEGLRPIATAMLAGEPGGLKAEVAIAVRSDMKKRGIGWSLLQHVLGYAEAAGIECVVSTESRDNTAALGVERDAGFGIHQCEDDPADVIASKTLANG